MGGSPEELYKKINPFDWNQEFPKIFKRKNPGFDAVIGNPPYVRQALLTQSKQYLRKSYSVYHGSADLYAYFIERGISLMRSQGLFSFIVANKWLRASYGGPLRSWLSHFRLHNIVDFGDLPVFQNATTYPCIIIAQKAKPQESSVVTLVQDLDFLDLHAYVAEHRHSVSCNSLSAERWSLVNARSQKLLHKLQSCSASLADYIDDEICRGVLSGFDQAFVIDQDAKARLISANPECSDLIKPYLMGRDIHRYTTPPSGRFLIFTRRGTKIKGYPAILRHLSAFKNQLIPKPKAWKPQKDGDKWPGRKSGPYKWYEIQDAMDYFEKFERPKIVYLKFQVRPAFSLDDSGAYPNSAVWVIPKNDLYLLGILNSKLGWYLISNYCTQIQSGYQLIYRYLRDIPIRTIDFDSLEEKAMHDKMVTFVDRMLVLHKQLPAAKIPDEKTKIQRQITATDKKIDNLVYTLYNLTKQEIKIVEESRP